MLLADICLRWSTTILAGRKARPLDTTVRKVVIVTKSCRNRMVDMIFRCFVTGSAAIGFSCVLFRRRAAEFFLITVFRVKSLISIICRWNNIIDSSSSKLTLSSLTCSSMNLVLFVVVDDDDSFSQKWKSWWEFGFSSPSQDWVSQSRRVPLIEKFSIRDKDNGSRISNFQSCPSCWTQNGLYVSKAEHTFAVIFTRSFEFRFIEAPQVFIE